jgi:excisionase family DNA binding protein
MSVSFVTSFSHEEFKSFIKQSIREVLNEERTAGLKESSDDDLMDVENTAKFLGMAVPTIYEKTSRRLIPHLKQGKKIYFSKRELKAWLNKGKVKTMTEIHDEASSYVTCRKKI